MAGTNTRIMNPRVRELPEPMSVPAEELPATDLVRLLRHFGVRALVLGVVSCLVGMTTVALCLAVAGLVLLYAPVRQQ